MPLIFPEKANTGPKDLGTKSISEVNSAFDAMYGLACKEGVIKPDTFSTLTSDDRAEVSRLGRQIANDRFKIIRQVAEVSVALHLSFKMIRWILSKAVGPKRAVWLTRLVLAAILAYRWAPMRRLSKEPYPKEAPTIFPLLGVLPVLAKNRPRLHDYLLEMAKKTNFQTLELPVPMACAVTLMDARDREYVLKTNPWNYLKNRKDDPMCFERVFAELLGRGIFSTDGSEWFHARKIASHMFSGNALRLQMEHVFNHHADRVVALLKQTAAGTGKLVDMQEVFQSSVFDAFCEIAFGAFPNATASAIEGTKPQFLVSFDMAQQIASERIATTPLGWNLSRLWGMATGLGREGELIHHLKVINEYIYRIIDERLMDKDVSTRHDLLSLYIQYSRAQKQPFTREDYRDIIANFMIAGRDTTSCTLTYATKFLGENLHVLRRLKEEGLFDLAKLDSKHGGMATVTWEESRTIPYVDAFVNEVLRMAPPVGDDLRICVGDDVLPSGLKIREGTRVVILNTAIGRDPFLWSNPDSFDPERWMRYDSQGVPQPVRRVDEYVHPIFFAGRRLCLGKDMARFETVVFMSKLFAEFEIEPLVPKDTTMVMGPVIFISGGFPCKVKLRKQ